MAFDRTESASALSLRAATPPADAGKEIMGRKALLSKIEGRHAMVDTDGPALELLVHSADIQDRDGTVSLLRQFRQRHPFVERIYVDSANNGDRVRGATSISIVKSETALLYPAAASISSGASLVTHAIHGRLSSPSGISPLRFRKRCRISETESLAHAAGSPANDPVAPSSPARWLQANDRVF